MAIPCETCGQEATTIRTTSEFSATSATGWRVATETPLCQMHADQEEETAA